MNKIEELVSNNRPSKILVRTEKREAVFYMSPQNASLSLKNEGELEGFLSTLRLTSFEMQEYSNPTAEDSYIEFVFNWENLKPHESVMRKIHNLFREHSATELTISTSFEFQVETDSGNFASNISSPEINLLYEHLSKLQEKIMGDVKDLIVTYSDEDYLLSQYRLHSEVTMHIRRVFKDFEKLKVNMPNEFKHRLKNLESGVIVTSFHEVIKLEHVIPMLLDIDPRASEFSCCLGDNLISTTIPKIEDSKEVNLLKSLHYKYYIMGKITDKKMLQKALDLVYAGKTVIIGFSSTSLYGCLMSYLSIVGDNSFEVSRHLSSVAGFFHPKLSINTGDLSLEDSECVPLSDQRVKDISEGKFSKSSFMRFSERSSKTFRLGDSTKTDSSQKEEFNEMLEDAVKRKASDIHLVVNAVPKFRIDKKFHTNYSNTILTPDVMHQIVSFLLVEDSNMFDLESKGSTFLPYSIPGIGRFRIQITRQRGTYACVIRHTPFDIPTAKEMKIPDIIVQRAVNSKHGLIIVSGPTSAGKSTTSSILIDNLKNSEPMSIVSIADPIEYIHSHGKGTMTQIEIPTDVPTFGEALTSSFRMDPNVVEIGEMRDLESIQAFLRLANSGHLAITSWHSESVIAIFSSIVTKVGESRRDEVLDTLASQGVIFINQKRVVGIKDKSIAVFEYLIPNAAFRQMISRGKFVDLESLMKTDALGTKNNCAWGDYELIELYLKKEITQEVMFKNTTDKDNLSRNIPLVANARGIKI